MIVRTRAPGRVNLIGEHTDYNRGYALPMAIDLECRVTAEAADRWTVSSRQFGEEFALTGARTGRWTDYVEGVVVEFGGEPRRLTVDSTVPVGGGLSSSASLEVAVALALDPAIDRRELVRRTNRVEREFLGVPCGIMDQFAAVFGRAGHALLLDCRTEEAHPVRLPEEAAVVVVNSMVKHSLAGSAYGERVAECRAAARALGIESLRDAASDGGSRRARHVISENRRVVEFVEAAERGGLAAMGRLMAESHASLRDDYEVSCEELDFLVETARDLPGVFGARMTGAGFGGCTVNLVEAGEAAWFEQTIVEAYRGRFGRTPEVYPVAAAGGASIFQTANIL